MLFHHDTNNVMMTAAQVTPPVAVSSLKVLGVNVPDVAIILTVIYTALQIVFLVKDRLFSSKSTRNL